MLDVLRDKAYQALTSPLGDQLKPVKWAKTFALFMNEMAGKPLARREELAERRERERTRVTKLAEARARRAEEERVNAAAAYKAPEPMPVTIYVDDNSARELQRMSTVLAGRDIPWKKLDVEHDEASKSWVRAHGRGHELPLLFIGDQVVGGYDELVQLDVEGKLTKLVFGR